MACGTFRYGTQLTPGRGKFLKTDCDIHRLTDMRRWQTIRASSFGRHLHSQPYAAVVLSGGYEEAGDQGRFSVQAGQAIFHDGFEMHSDRFPKPGALILNLQLQDGWSYKPGVANVADPDSIARVAEKSLADAAEILILSVSSHKQPSRDWPDELAAALIRNPSLRLSEWSSERQIAPWALTRGFASVFGISPEVFRVRARARRAWNFIRYCGDPLAVIAAGCGFADQSHMTRAVKQLTGKAPLQWRTIANGFKTKHGRMV